jgi:hypothetical protein
MQAKEGEVRSLFAVRSLVFGKSEYFFKKTEIGYFLDKTFPVKIAGFFKNLHFWTGSIYQVIKMN